MLYYNLRNSNKSTIHSILSMQLIALLFISSFLFISEELAMGTTYPIPEDLKQKHFYNDDLADTLAAELDSLEKKFQTLEERAGKFKGVKKLTPFTYAKYSVHYTPEQVENFMETGWIQTKKFGWALSKKNILETLPPWMKDLEDDIADLEAGFPPDSIPKDRIKTLKNTRRRISDFMATRKTYLTRLKKWDEWCRKGPWLIEESNPDRLASEIESLKIFISGEAAVCPSWLQEGSHASDSDADLDADSLLKLAKVNLEKKQKVWNWYYGFRKKP